MLTYCIVRIFEITLRIIPTRTWSSEALTGVDFFSLPPLHGDLDVDLKINPSLKGAFKTAHSGTINLYNGVLPPPLSGNVCVKQAFYSDPDGPVRHYDSSEEKTLIQTEVGCLDWARILLNLTYEFINTHDEECGDFPGTIPQLHFVEAAIARSNRGKFFLVEEWIDTSEVPFTKYINNARAVSCISQYAPEEAQNTANFLCFAQHVQYQFTLGTLFTSDYQGMSQALSAQISS